MARRVLVLIFPLLFAAPALAQDDVLVLGKKRTEWLQMFYKSDELKLRRAGLFALEVYGAKADGVLPALLERLKTEPDDDLRLEIAQTIGRMGEDAREAVKTLGERARADKVARVREAAAKALGGAMAPYSKKALKDLIAVLRDPEPGPRTAAADTLKDMGPDALGALPDMLDVAKDVKIEAATRVFVIQALGRFGAAKASETVPVIEAQVAVEKNPVAVRVAAVESLGRLGAEAKKTVGVVKAAMAYGVKEPELRKAAILAFGKIGGPSKETWPDLQDLYTDYDSFIRSQAIRLSGPLGKDIPEVLLELEAAALSDQNLEVRLAAVQELGALGPAAVSITPTLEAISTRGRTPALRDEAKVALKKVKGA